MQIDKDVIASLPREDQKLVMAALAQSVGSTVFAPPAAGSGATAAAGGRQQQGGNGALSSPSSPTHRAQQHYTVTPGHQSLLESPSAFELKFNKACAVKLPSAASVSVSASESRASSRRNSPSPHQGFKASPSGLRSSGRKYDEDDEEVAASTSSSRFNGQVAMLPDSSGDAYGSGKGFSGGGIYSLGKSSGGRSPVADGHISPSPFFRGEQQAAGKAAVGTRDPSSGRAAGVSGGSHQDSPDADHHRRFLPPLNGGPSQRSGRSPSPASVPGAAVKLASVPRLGLVDAAGSGRASG